MSNSFRWEANEMWKERQACELLAPRSGGAADNSGRIRMRTRRMRYRACEKIFCDPMSPRTKSRNRTGPIYRTSMGSQYALTDRDKGSVADEPLELFQIGVIGRDGEEVEVEG